MRRNQPRKVDVLTLTTRTPKQYTGCVSSSCYHNHHDSIVRYRRRRFGTSYIVSTMTMTILLSFVLQILLVSPTFFSISKFRLVSAWCTMTVQNKRRTSTATVHKEDRNIDSIGDVDTNSPSFVSTSLFPTTSAERKRIQRDGNSEVTKPSSSSTIEQGVYVIQRVIDPLVPVTPSSVLNLATEAIANNLVSVTTNFAESFVTTATDVAMATADVAVTTATAMNVPPGAVIMDVIRLLRRTVLKFKSRHYHHSSNNNNSSTALQVLMNNTSASKKERYLVVRMIQKIGNSIQYFLNIVTSYINCILGKL